MSQDPDRAFRRFLRSAHSADLAQVFDATAPELLDVARYLTRGSPEAEDLVQSTFLVALEQRSEFDPSGRVVPWLLGILANQARRQRRRAARRPEADRLRRPAAVDPAEDLQRREMGASFVHALEAVPAKYRRVVEERLWQGRRATDIARELGCAPAKVRVWFQRGMKHFRQALPRGLAPAVVGLPIDPGALERIRAEVLRAATPSAGAVGVGAGLLGVLKLKELLAAATVLLLAWVSWRSLRPTEPPPTPGTGTAVAEAARSTATPGSISAIERGPTGVDRQPMADAPGSTPNAEPNLAPTPSVWLRGRLEWPADLPAGVDLGIRAVGGAAEGIQPRATVDRDGTFEANVTALFTDSDGDPPAQARPDELFLELDHPAFVPEAFQVFTPAPVPPDARGREWIEVELHPRAATTVTGSVLGHAEGIVEVLLVPRVGERPLELVVASTRCVEGRFELRTAAEGEHYLLALTASARPAARALHLFPGTPLELEPFLLEEGARVSGRLEWMGAPAAPPSSVEAVYAPPEGGQRLRLLRRHHLLVRDGVFERGRAQVSVGEGGAFAFTGLAPGSHLLRCGLLAGVSARDRDNLEPPVSVNAPRSGLILGAGCAVLRVEFRVQGRPCTATEADGVALGYAPESDPDAGGVVLLDPDGSVQLQVAPDTAYVVTPYSRNGAFLNPPRRVQAPPGGAEARVVFELETFESPESGTLVVDLLDGEGRPVSEAGFALRRSIRGNERTLAEWHLRAPDGRFVLPEVPAGAGTLVVQPGSRVNRHDGEFPRFERDLVLPAGERLERSWIAHRGGRLRLAARSPQGDFLPAAVELTDAAGRRQEVSFVFNHPDGWTDGGDDRLSRTGVHTVEPPLAPGEYRLRLEHPDFDPRTLALTLEAGRTTEVQAVLEPSHP